VATRGSTVVFASGIVFRPGYTQVAWRGDVLPAISYQPMWPLGPVTSSATPTATTTAITAPLAIPPTRAACGLQPGFAATGLAVRRRLSRHQQQARRASPTRTVLRPSTTPSQSRWVTEEHGCKCEIDGAVQDRPAEVASRTVPCFERFAPTLAEPSPDASGHSSPPPRGRAVRRIRVPCLRQARGTCAAARRGYASTSLSGA